MKTFIKTQYLSAALAGIVAFFSSDRASAQPFTNAHSFKYATDGGYVQGSLVASGNTLFGGTDEGGTFGNGTIFRINSDGTAFTNIHNFPATAGSPPTNSDGAFVPYKLAIAGNVLFGTANEGGTNGRGTIFRINTDGSSFTNLHSFSAGVGPRFVNTDGAYPNGGVVFANGTLYGTTTYGGTAGWGTVFAISADGTVFTNLHNFTGTNDGVNPVGSLLLSGSTLYGTTESGSPLTGYIYSINTNGTGYTNFYGFGFNDGYSPYAGVTKSGNFLYGTTYGSGSTGNGTVYRVNTDGTGITNLHVFSSSVSNVNFDGAFPQSDLVLIGNVLYGTTMSGGSAAAGTVFALSTDGAHFANLHAFTALPGSSPFTNSDGANAASGLVLSGTNLLGTTENGGAFGYGVMYSFPLPSLLNMNVSGTNLVFTWPAEFSVFNLQTSTNLGTNAVWTTASPSPVIINGQYTVTNSTSPSVPRRFYRIGL